MFSSFKKSKTSGYVFSLIIIILVYLLFLNAWEINDENDGTNSGYGLLQDKGFLENGRLQLDENTSNRRNKTEFSSKFVFINSYMRSGSTFLGQMLGLRSDTFYFYEPLHKVWTWKYTNGSKLCHLKKPTCEHSYDALGTSLNFLSDAFNCRLQNHSQKINQVLLKTLSGPKWNSFNKCVVQRGEVKECLVKAEEQCLPTKYRVVKVLRMSLADVALLLPKHPNLTIVHLFRDPRGLFSSHITTGWFPMKTGRIAAFADDTKSICKKITDDLVTGRMLKTKFPDRVKLVQYEDIYNNVEKAKILYRWLGMDLIQESVEFLRTNVQRKDVNMEESSNLSGHFKYRKTLPFEYIQIIDKECKDAIRMLGLKLYNTEADLRDEEFNPIDGKLPFEL